jgi:thymidine kinase
VAKLYFRYGAMNSGKSTHLQQVAHNYEEKGMKVVIIKPSLDTRKKGYIYSRIGLKRKADYDISKKDSLVDILAQIAVKKYNSVLVDEAQFLSENQVDELYVFTKKYNIPVICYGLRTDFSSHLFTGSKRLFEIADELEELATICECSRKARFNARRYKDAPHDDYLSEGEPIEIDDGTKYVYNSICGECYFKKVLRKL